RNVMEGTASQTGLALSIMSLAYALASVQYGRVASRLDELTVLTVAIGLAGGGFLLIWAADGWAMLVLGVTVERIGMGLFEPSMILWLANAVSPGARGRVIGGLTAALFLGQFLSSIVVQPAAARLGPRGLYLSVSVILLVTAPLLWVVRHRLRALADRAASRGKPISDGAAFGLALIGCDHSQIAVRGGRDDQASTGKRSSVQPCGAACPAN
ncbi:MAG: MFS transporter, partial [Anaerolineae bacterium]